VVGVVLVLVLVLGVVLVLRRLAVAPFLDVDNFAWLLATPLRTACRGRRTRRRALGAGAGAS
jgi:hypothetical protein